MGVNGHIDLFSGIGGFALAAERTGFHTRVFCEKDFYCQAILRKHWPSIPIVQDIRDFDGKRHRGAELLTGGFPCQPFSQAGRQLGKEDDRYLWPEMLRIIQEAKPTWIVGENVFGIINLALEQVHFDLENLHYEVETLIIPAAGVGAPHRRDRCWIIARVLGDSEHDGLSSDKSGGGLQHQPKKQEEQIQVGKSSGTSGIPENVADSAGWKRGEVRDTCEKKGTRNCDYIPGDGGGLLRECPANIVADSIGNSKGATYRGSSGKRGRKDTNIIEGGKVGSNPRNCGEDVSYSNSTGCGERCGAESVQEENATPERSRPRTAETKWISEPGFCRMVNGLPFRVDRIKCLGNAIVPQVAETIFEKIKAVNQSLTKQENGGNRNDD